MEGSNFKTIPSSDPNDESLNNSSTPLTLTTISLTHPNSSSDSLSNDNNNNSNNHLTLGNNNDNNNSNNSNNFPDSTAHKIQTKLLVNPIEEEEEEYDENDGIINIGGYTIIPSNVSSLLTRALEKRYRLFAGFIFFLLIILLIIAYWAGASSNSTDSELLTDNTDSSLITIEPARKGLSRTKKGLITSLISPGLSWCESNPFLELQQMNETEELEILWSNWWEDEMNRTITHFTKYQELRSRGQQTDDHAPILAEFQNLIFPHSLPMKCSNPMVRFGDHYDTSKFICNLNKLEEWSEKTGEECNIFSLGSNNQFDFESHVSRSTKRCTFTTLDCTSRPPNVPVDRLTFLPYCLGNERTEPGGRRFIPLSKLLREKNYTQIHFLKMDIELGELDVYSDILSLHNQNNNSTDIDGLLLPSKFLPWQISFESHWWPADYNAVKTLAMFHSLWRAGYRFVYSETNEFNAGCAEWIILRTFC